MDYKKTILAVFNSSNKGKTETIREFANLIKINFPNLKPILPIPFEIPLQGDIKLIVEINGIIVGIVSQGDPNTGLKEKLLCLTDKFNCDLIICTSRTRGETIHAVDNLFETKGFQTIWTSTYQVADVNLHSHVNTLKAKHILDLLQNLNLL